MLKQLLPAFAATIVLLLTACEPISVSVSPKGEVAFTRGEGVFYYDTKSKKVETLFWNEGKKVAPAIVKWSEDGAQFAYTLKESKDAMSTDIFVATKGEVGKKITTINGVVTKMVWSPDGKFLSYATGGEDSDMGVADIGIVDLSTNMSKILVKNCADIFYWPDAKSIVTIKLNAKVADFDGRFIGALVKTAISGTETALTEAFVTEKKGAMDGTSKGEILFTSLSLDVAMKADSALSSALYKTMGDKKVAKVLDKGVTHIAYGPNENEALLITKVVKTVDYTEKKYINLELFDPAKKSAVVLRKDVKNSISVETNTLDLIPAWLDGDNVLYFELFAPYGSSTSNLALCNLNIAKKSVENLQPTIDSEINRIIMSKGGY